MTAFNLCQIRFRSPALQPTASELADGSEGYINPGVYAAMLADRIAPVLTARTDLRVDRVVESHGVHFYCKGSFPFTIHVVCTSLGEVDEHLHLVFVEPAKKTLRPFPWLRSYETGPVVLDLVEALRKRLLSFSDVTELTLVPHDQPL